MWRTLKNGQKRSYAHCKLCGLWLSAQTVRAHWEDAHWQEWLELQFALDADPSTSEAKETT